MTSMAALAALTITGVACQDDNDADTDLTETLEAPAADSRDADRDAAPASVRVSGCLQEADGDYVLTTNTPEASASQPNQPQSAQLAAARDAYRLSGDDDNLEKMLGSRVQVTGTVEERADLPTLEPRGGAAQSQSPKPLDIDPSELAELTVTSIQSTGESCGARDARSNAATGQ
jgi:hypothetical protein